MRSPWPPSVGVRLTSGHGDLRWILGFNMERLGPSERRPGCQPSSGTAKRQMTFASGSLVERRALILWRARFTSKPNFKSRSRPKANANACWSLPPVSGRCNYSTWRQPTWALLGPSAKTPRPWWIDHDVLWHALCHDFQARLHGFRAAPGQHDLTALHRPARDGG